MEDDDSLERMVRESAYYALRNTTPALEALVAGEDSLTYDATFTALTEVIGKILGINIQLAHEIDLLRASVRRLENP